MKRFRYRKYTAQTYEEACEWFVEFRTDNPGESECQAFQAWLRESPANVAAYLDVTTAWGRWGSVDVMRHWPQQMLIAEAKREAAAGAAIVQLPSAVPASMTADRRRGGEVRRRRVLRYAMAASLAIGVAGVGYTTWTQRSGVYSTGIGEQRSLVLRDGSTVDIDAHSTVRVHYTNRERDVDLLQGQALFSVAKNPAYPFIVRAGSIRVRAVGTQFDVYRKDSATLVTVVEGRVAVSGSLPSGDARSSPGVLAPPRSVSSLVSAGEELTVTAAAAPLLIHVDTAMTTAWTQNRLVFNAAPLSELVEEFSRYSPRRLVIADPGLANLKVDGVFSSRDPRALIEFLRHRPGIQVTETDTQIIIGRR